MPRADRLLATLERELGTAGLVTAPDLLQRHACDWTREEPCPPVAVIRPGTTAELAAALALCNEAGCAVVVQGGLTGLAGGATPRAGELALSLERISGVEALDAAESVMTVRAGTRLESAQRAAEDAGLALPLDLASRGSCTIGGNIATNAGGNRVLRYGMARNLVLGLEAVLADGTVLSSLLPMLKNNAGYDLKQLFIGSEGTLGVVTRAVLRLYPQPAERLTALVALSSFEDLVDLLQRLRREHAATLSSFEAMWSDYFECALGAFALGRPFDERHAFYAVVELEASDPEADRARFERTLAAALDAGRATDAILAGSLDEAGRLWRIRECAGELLGKIAPAVAFDVSMPIAAMPEYVQAVREGVAALRMDRPFCAFGHLGDGNLHLLVGARSAADSAQVEALVYGALHGRGSVSAEHGIGRHKRPWLGHTRSAVEIATMRALKGQLDPRSTLNAGRVI
jgi:FAD/FMN-containing dehydrogenase